ncbi:MAG: tautomerase family protein [Kineosporiaceae bacterium]|nr:tautomerase family protein [Kineosporiaceae bacterium]
MPLVEVTLATGRTPEQLRALMREVHEAVVRSVGAPDANVRVVVREVPPTHWSAGGVTLAERRAAEEGN